MKRIASVPFLLFALFLVHFAALPLAAAGVEVGGVRFEDTAMAGTNKLALVGAGLARRFAFKVFSGAFYMEAGRDSSQRFEDVPKRLELQYYLRISGEAFAEATEDSLTESLTAKELRSIREDLDRLKAAFEDVAKGDRYSLTYVPGEGMSLALNGKAKAYFADKAFANAVFGIWLGDKPIDKKFRKAALGGK